MRMRMMFCLLLIAACATASAQKKDAKPASKTANKKAAMAMPMMQQSPEMAKLEKLFAGSWTLDSVVEPMPEVGMMQRATSKGTQTSRRGPGGNSLIDEMKATGATGTITGHGVVWYDPMAGGYQATWCDNQTPTGCMPNGIGKFVGNDLIFEGDIAMPPQAGGKMHMKESYTDVTPNSFTFSIDGGPDAAHMKHMMTIKYKRAGGATAAKK